MSVLCSSSQDRPNVRVVDINNGEIVNSDVESVLSLRRKGGLVYYYALVVHLQFAALEKGELAINEGRLWKVVQEVGSDLWQKLTDFNGRYRQWDVGLGLLVVFFKDCASGIVLRRCPSLLCDQRIVVVGSDVRPELKLLVSRLLSIGASSEAEVSSSDRHVGAD
jgi:hypothetical protein